jgi:hypothetical protein
LREMIITNNPSVVEKYPENVFFIGGSVEQVLVKVRDMVHKGHELISHPLPASLRILFSPYRSVIIGGNSGDIDPLQVEIAENSILKYKRHMDVREIDQGNNEDYQKIDLILLESALKDEQGK